MSLLNRVCPQQKSPHLNSYLLSICTVPGTMWRYQGRENTKTNQKASALRRQGDSHVVQKLEAQPNLNPKSSISVKENSYIHAFQKNDYMYTTL